MRPTRRKSRASRRPRRRRSPGVSPIRFAFLGMHETGQSPVVARLPAGAEAVECVGARTAKISGDSKDGARRLFAVRRDPARGAYMLGLYLAGHRPRRRRPLLPSDWCLASSICTFLRGRPHGSRRASSARSPPSTRASRGSPFSVWAPNSRSRLDRGRLQLLETARRHPMRLRHTARIWELLLPRIGPVRALHSTVVVGKHGETLTP